MARPRAILFIGPPGAGKGTQAEALVSRFPEYQHFDTGHVIEKILTDPRNQDDPVIRSERERFEKGLLNTSSWTEETIREGVRRIATAGQGIVLSGAPRTREDVEFLVPLLGEVYGEGTIAVIHLVVKNETSIFRNTHRRVCKRCASALPWSIENEKLTYCPICGGELATRSLDNAKAIELRLREYLHCTETIFPYLEALGIPIFEVNGERAPSEVSEDINRILTEKFS